MHHSLLGLCDAKHDPYETQLLLVTIKLYSDNLTVKSRKPTASPNIIILTHKSQ